MAPCSGIRKKLFPWITLSSKSQILSKRSSKVKLPGWKRAPHLERLLMGHQRLYLFFNGRVKRLKGQEDGKFSHGSWSLMTSYPKWNIGSHSQWEARQTWSQPSLSNPMTKLFFEGHGALKAPWLAHSWPLVFDGDRRSRRAVEEQKPIKCHKTYESPFPNFDVHLFIFTPQVSLYWNSWGTPKWAINRVMRCWSHAVGLKGGRSPFVLTIRRHWVKMGLIGLKGLNTWITPHRTDKTRGSDAWMR